MQQLIIYSLLISAATVLAAPSQYCPNGCTCDWRDRLWQVHCQFFFNILTKPTPAQLATIDSLDLSHSSISSIDPDAVRLTKLKRLNLHSNGITAFNVEQLPKSLQVLDLSENKIADIPKSWHMLPRLKQLNLTGNPISCDCNSLKARDYLRKAKVDLVGPVACDSPSRLRGQSWVSVTSPSCDESDGLFGDVQGDEPYEGSGSGDVGYISADGNDGNLTDDGEFIPVSEHSEKTTTPTTFDDGDEGSGDFGGVPGSIYDEYEEEEERVNNASLDGVHACHFNCSTPPPLEVENGTDVSPAPGLLDGIRIIASDLGILASSSTPQPSTTTLAPEPVTEDVVISKKADVANAEPTKVLDEPLPKEASVLDDARSTYIFLAGLAVVMVCLIIYAVLRRRRRGNHRLRMQHRNGNKSEPAHPGEELKLLNKPSPPIEKVNGSHETSALMDNHKEDKPDPASFEEVELRPKIKESNHLLTPPAKRVTIKATELPNSVPKTPILVTRHVSRDGNIVTTPTDQTP